MPKFTIIKKTHTYLVYDREALQRKAHEVVVKQDEEFHENYPDHKDDDRHMSPSEYLAYIDAMAKEPGEEGEAIWAWLDMIPAEDPEGDHNGYTLLYSHTESSNKQPSDSDLGVFRLGIEIGHKLVRQNADGSNGIATVRKVKRHHVSVEGDERRYEGGGNFPLTHFKSGAALVGFANDLISTAASLRGHSRLMMTDYYSPGAKPRDLI